MRPLPFLTAAVLLPAVASARQPSAEERFNHAMSKPQPVKLDDAAYQRLTSAPRDYSVAVLLTALGAQFGCELCHEFQPEWHILAKSWTTADKNKESRLVFATLDFLDGKQTFQELHLQTAPILLLWHPTVGPHARLDKPMEMLDFNSGIDRADKVHQWISGRLPDRPHPPLVRPVNYHKIAVSITAVVGLVTLLAVVGPYLLPILQNRNLWAAISLIAVLLFTSGRMFNRIRKVPYVAGNGKGGFNYFAPGFQSQLGLETQIIAAIYGVLAFATISLALKTPRIQDPKAQQTAVIVWGGVILAVYSLLLNLFRIKNNGYPFWLPPF